MLQKAKIYNIVLSTVCVISIIAHENPSILAEQAKRVFLTGKAFVKIKNGTVELKAHDSNFVPPLCDMPMDREALIKFVQLLSSMHAEKPLSEINLSINSTNQVELEGVLGVIQRAYYDQLLTPLFSEQDLKKIVALRGAIEAGKLRFHLFVQAAPCKALNCRASSFKSNKPQDADIVFVFGSNSSDLASCIMQVKGTKWWGLRNSIKHFSTANINDSQASKKLSQEISSLIEPTKYSRTMSFVVRGKSAVNLKELASVLAIMNENKGTLTHKNRLLENIALLASCCSVVYGGVMLN